MIEALKLIIDPLAELDWTDDIKCPYCGYDNDTADAFDGGEPKSWTCGRCDMDFDVEVEYSCTFRSIRRDTKGEDDIHGAMD